MRIEVHPLVVVRRLRRTVFLADRALANRVASSARPFARFEDGDLGPELSELVRRAHAGQPGAENQHFGACRRWSLQSKRARRLRNRHQAERHHGFVGHRRARRSGKAFEKDSSCQRHTPA